MIKNSENTPEQEACVGCDNPEHNHEDVDSKAEQEIQNLEDNTKQSPEEQAKVEEFINSIAVKMQDLEKAKAESDKAKIEALEKAGALSNALREAQNDVTRARKQADENVKVANAAFAKDVVLPGIDCMFMALKAAQNSPDVFGGIKMAYDAMISSLTKYNIELINANPGEMPDVNLHEVLGSIETDEFPAGSIINLARLGYMINGSTVLRTASVIVAK